MLKGTSGKATPKGRLPLRSAKTDVDQRVGPLSGVSNLKWEKIPENSVKLVLYLFQQGTQQ